MAGSTEALDVSAPITQDLKYILASNINVSNFVSVKLSGRINYRIWKAQMLCLIESQLLLHIIDAEKHFPVDKGVHMIGQYDKLVKGWIFGSISDHVLNNFADFDSARDLWMQLESRFIGLLPNVLEVSTRTEDLKYMLALNVNVSKFVSVKLSGHQNYDVWKTQMLCLIESHNLLDIIYANIRDEGEGDRMTQKYDKLVIGWIFGTMSDRVLKDFRYTSVQLVWRELESTFTNLPIAGDREGDSWVAYDVYSPTQELKYVRASNVNVSNFVTVKLSGHSNYKIWRAQMLCLIKSQELFHIIRCKQIGAANKYDNLVIGWIFGTMNDELVESFTGRYSARYIWTQLESSFNPSDSNDDTSPGFEFRSTDFVRVPDIEYVEIMKIIKKQLYEAAVEGCWWKAKSILKIHKKTATEAIIAANGNTILHIAVEMGNNYFVKKLLEFSKDENDMEKKNNMGQTALHIAARVGNIHAVQLLVQKRKELSVILDNNGNSPLDISYANMMLNISACLLKFPILCDLSTYPYQSRENAIFSAILTKQFEYTRALLYAFPECASQNYLILKAITITFPTDLGFTVAFIYPSFHNVYTKTIDRGSSLFHSKLLDKCVDDILRLVNIYDGTFNSWLGKVFMMLLVPTATLYPIYQLICLIILVLRLPFSMLYFIMWKVFAGIVHPIKNIEKKKKCYIEAKKILRLICDQMGPSHRGYGESIIEAVRQGTYEVVDEILFTSPQTINCKDEEGHNVVQLTIINRAEKIYNLIYHIAKSYRKTKDSAKNNLAHLAGRLAPSVVLSHTAGAALQLQRELMWREEMEKLMLPLELTEKNIYLETPAMMFTREHQDLIKQGENWTKTTAESCSITAALIVTIVFAAAITVPGGSNQESGIPIFKKETAFDVFAFFNALSLFTAATALLLFLSILTTRFSERDFLVTLPRKLICGLVMLFLATTSMIVAFGAILFLVFCDRRPWMLAPIFGFACLPILVMVTIKLPLLVDFIQSTYFPILGKKSADKSCKINRENTFFNK